MADYSELKAAIRAAIYDNVAQDITGDKLQEILLEMVDELGQSYVAPDGGIPASDLSYSVRSSLNKADAAMPGITVIPDVVWPGISLARYVATELTATGTYSFVWVGTLSDGDSSSNSGSVYSIILKIQGRASFRLVLFGRRVYTVKDSAGAYTLEEYVSMSDLAEMAETWTFTLSDESTVTKKIVVLP